MKILYMSCHSILEFDEVRMFTELGHEVYSLHGAYVNPGAPSDKRPAIPNLHFSQSARATELALQCSRENILPQLLDLFDITIVMHRADWIIRNWQHFNGRNVVLRTIGQNTQNNENQIAPFVRMGLKVVRYSPSERNIPGYVGEDAMIRFGKEPGEYSGWTGGSGQATSFVQSLPERGGHCGFSFIDGLAAAEPRFKLYGPGNESLSYSGGTVSSERQIEIMQQSDAYVSLGTHPASYTLNFMEAMMVGTPMIVGGQPLGNPRLSGYQQDTYEVPDLIEHAETGLVANSVRELIDMTALVLNNRSVAEALSERGRARAIELFGMDNIKKQWAEFLNG